MLASKALAAAVSQEPVYVEDVFSTYLYTGNGSTQTITNGIDLSGKGGLVWIKSRAGTYVREHYLYDTARGTILSLSTNTTGANVNNSPNGVTAFNSDGFTALGPLGAGLTASGTTYASWTFREQAKFFDVVTYTGTGSARTVAHSLGSVPGCIIIKGTGVVDNWYVWHRSLPSTTQSYLNLNTTGATASSAFLWGNTAPGAVNFTVSGTNNTAGQTYVAYLFAHNAGGFGLSGTDNVISCGSYTGNGSATGPTVTLGYEPQWLLIKRTDTSGLGWYMQDVMRGFSQTQTTLLEANSSAAEVTINVVTPTATGFQLVNTQTGYNENGGTYIYIAIRRGPMKVPTSGTSVFVPVNYTGNGSSQTITTGITSDWVLSKSKSNIEQSIGTTRLSGFSRVLTTTNSQAEVYIDPTYFVTAMNNTAYNLGSGDGNSNTYTYTSWNFRRAPGFFDVVCYTGDGVSTRSLTHNLGVAPELAIFKSRSYAGSSWVTFQKDVCTSANQLLGLNTNNSVLVTGNYFPSGFSSSITSTTLNNIGNSTSINRSGDTYVAYLFATVAGVSKVGSYTGSGTTKQIDCGFTAGARFVLIKRTDSTGDWYVYDSARGIVAGNDPYLLLNSTAAEVTSTDYVDTYSAGFELSSTAPAGLNASGGTYIFLAIA